MGAPTRRCHSLARLLGVLLGIGASAALYAAQSPMVDLRGSKPPRGNAVAGEKASAVCAACHGAKGVAVVPSFPDLAGQSAGYLLVQLRGFAAGWRHNATMQGQAARLDAQQMVDLAAFFAAQPRPPAGKPQRHSTAAKLFHHGDPGRGIPACQGCHGIDGRGPRPHPSRGAPSPAWQTWPALAGLPAGYVVERLHALRGPTGLATSNTRIMHGVTQSLTEQDMQALAAYITAL